MKKLIILFFFLLISLSFNAQNQLERLNFYKKSIIGTWITEIDSTLKLHFSENNSLKIYIDNVLEESTTYYLDTTCRNQKNLNDIFLKIKIDSISYSCDFINNIYTNKKSISVLSITNERGTLEVFTKINN